MTHPGGRPPKFKTVDELQKLIDSYFDSCDPHMEEVSEWVQARTKDGKLKKDSNGLSYLIEVTHKILTKQQPYTINGLALALDTTRRTLIDYEKGMHDNREDSETEEDILNPKFSHTVRRAKQRIEEFWEINLASPSPTGTIFNLKNNFDWKDKTEQELTNPDGSLRPYKGLDADEIRKALAAKRGSETK